jgi:hypothetical protein
MPTNPDGSLTVSVAASSAPITALSVDVSCTEPGLRLVRTLSSAVDCSLGTVSLPATREAPSNSGLAVATSWEWNATYRPSSSREGKGLQHARHQ